MTRRRTRMSRGITYKDVDNLLIGRSQQSIEKDPDKHFPPAERLFRWASTLSEEDYDNLVGCLKVDQLNGNIPHSWTVGKHATSEELFQALMGGMQESEVEVGNAQIPPFAGRRAEAHRHISRL